MVRNLFQKHTTPIQKKLYPNKIKHTLVDRNLWEEISH